MATLYSGGCFGTGGAGTGGALSQGSAALKGGSGDAAPTARHITYRNSADSAINWPTYTKYSQVQP